MLRRKVRSVVFSLLNRTTTPRSIKVKLAAVLLVVFVVVVLAVAARRGNSLINMFSSSSSSAAAAAAAAASATALRAVLADSIHRDLSTVQRIIVIPGGGSGGDKHWPMPAHTQQRVDHAAAIYRDDGYCTAGGGVPTAIAAASEATGASSEEEASASAAAAAPPPLVSNGKCLFLVLGAGTMNARPSLHKESEYIVFESTAMLTRLTEKHGIPLSDIIAENQSWDSILNVWMVRNIVDALIAVHPRPRSLTVTVVISDFHADRFRAAMDWVFALSPPMLGLPSSDSDTDSTAAAAAAATSATRTAVPVSIVSVPTPLGVVFKDAAAREARMQHEQRGVAQIRANAKVVTTMAQLQAYLFLGGHVGMRRFTTKTPVPDQQEQQRAGW
jgi:hypothetical protein